MRPDIEIGRGSDADDPYDAPVAGEEPGVALLSGRKFRIGENIADKAGTSHAERPQTVALAPVAQGPSVSSIESRDVEIYDVAVAGRAEFRDVMTTDSEAKRRENVALQIYIIFALRHDGFGTADGQYAAVKFDDHTGRGLKPEA